MPKLNKYALYMVFGLIIAGVSGAGPIKNWTSNEYVRYTDLNAALNHLHASVGRNHGPVITAADIAPNAGIRPEQTTFGSVTRLVSVGTFKTNPDAGTVYVPVNFSGSYPISVNRLGGSPGTGFSIESAANAGRNTDGGSETYSVFWQVINFGPTARVECAEDSSSAARSGPLAIVVACYDWDVFSHAGSAQAPNGVAVQVYYNGVQ